MKKTFLFCTKLWLFLTEIPPIALLIISIIYNENGDQLFKLYPLIIFLALCILFIFLYFFRAIVISKEEIKCIGLFSSKDNAIINKDKTLILTMLPKKKIRVVLNGYGGASDYSWAKNDGSEPIEIALFREKAIGGNASVSRILKYFGVESDDIASAMSGRDFKKEYGYFILSVENSENTREIKLKFTETV